MPLDVRTVRPNAAASRRVARVAGCVRFGMRLTLLLAIAAMVWAVEVPATVVRVSDGDTIVATLAAGNEVKVRLLYIDTPESKDNSHGEATAEGKRAAEFLRAELPVDSRVELWSPADVLERDRYDRVLAVIWKHEAMYVGAAGGGAQHIQATRNINLAIVRAGWSPYWRKYGKAPGELDAAYAAAQEQARADNAGAWGTDPQYMIDTSHETTAPRMNE